MIRPLNRPMITVSIMLATVMQALDSTIANVALPHMQGSVSASQNQIAWVLTAYIVAAAIATPLTGWVADRFGQKRVFLVSIAGFTFASMLCGLSDSLTEIVAARLLQGVFGATLVPLAQVVLMEINPPEKYGPAMAIWSMGVMMGPILGPTLGGWLTDSYSWRWVFFINLPIGAFAFYGMWRFIRPTPGAGRLKFDVYGFASLSIAIGTLQLLLDRGEQNDWFGSTETWVEVIVLCVAFTFFAAHTALARPEKSFFDRRLLKNRNYATGLVIVFTVGLVIFAARSLIPTLLENLLSYPAATTGLVTAPAGVGAMLAMLITGRLVGKIESRWLMSAGFAMTALSLWEMTQYSLDLGASSVVWPSIIQGLGMGTIFVPLSTATFATLDPKLRAQGASTNSLLRNIGSSIGIALVQSLLVRNTHIMHASLTAHITYANPAWAKPAVAAAYNLSTPAGAAALDNAITRQATMIAYIDDFWLMLGATVLVTPLVLLFKPPRRAAV